MATPPKVIDSGGDDVVLQLVAFAALVKRDSAQGNGPLVGARRSSSVVGPSSASGDSGDHDDPSGYTTPPPTKMSKRESFRLLCGPLKMPRAGAETV